MEEREIKQQSSELWNLTITLYKKAVKTGEKCIESISEENNLQKFVCNPLKSVCSDTYGTIKQIIDI